jgi:hypothetical protein
MGRDNMLPGRNLLARTRLPLNISMVLLMSGVLGISR